MEIRTKKAGPLSDPALADTATNSLPSPPPIRRLFNQKLGGARPRQSCPDAKEEKGVCRRRPRGRELQ